MELMVLSPLRPRGIFREPTPLSCLSLLLQQKQSTQPLASTYLDSRPATQNSIKADLSKPPT